MKKIYFIAVLFVFAGLSAFAQNDNGRIKITMQDKDTKESMPFANVVAYKDGVQIGVATTNMDGEAVIAPLPPGRYSIKGSFVGYRPTEVRDILVGEGKQVSIVLELNPGAGQALDAVEIIIHKIPLIDPDTKSGLTVDRESYQAMGSKDINTAAATTAGVYQADEGGGLNVRGGRQENTTYFVDGVKVFGKPNLPQSAIEQLNVITGGVPASYGDLIAGAISISTRGPQSKTFGSIELVSSQLTDKFGNNLLNFAVGGPIFKKKDSTRRTVLGYFISGQGGSIKEPSPSFVPIYVLKDGKLDEIKETPLLPSPSGRGFIRSSEFITKEDMTTQRFRPNAFARGVTLSGKLDYAPVANSNLSLGAFYEYGQAMNAGMANVLFNSDNNSVGTNRSFRTNLSFTQKFGNTTNDKDKTKSQSRLKNSFFKFLVSYENILSKTQNAKHKENLFNYGYIGNFERRFLQEEFAFNYDFTPSYTYNGVTANSYTYTGRRELPVVFTPGTQNPDAALYTSYLIAQTNSLTTNVSMDYIAGNNGLRNGDGVPSIYNLYNNFGAYAATYATQTREQFRVATSFNTDIGKHALTVGMEFDQRINSFFSVNAAGLWTRMRQITNDHTRQLDTKNPLVNPLFSGLVPYYYYNYAYEEDKQSQFSEKLLEKLGLDKNYTGFVNTDALDPSILTLDMFSAEDLLGNTDASNLVSYSGYSANGQRQKGSKTNMSDFLNAKDANGRNLFPIGSFRPIYASVFVMDKFDFKDMKFLIGLRVDRYDANQQVLKDKYALHELARVGDLASLENLPAGFRDNIPGSISKDAAVYVAQNPSGGKSPLSIRGYREGDKWFNSEGLEISDPSLIASSDSRPVPLYKDNANYDSRVSANAFTDYVAKVLPQPRLAFSFPISDEANFFAHYDVLIQRPFSLQLSPLDYYYMNASSTTPLITNPNQKPQQTIDYEFGFSQILNQRKSAALNISAFYKENRNLINQRVVVGAYPKNYIIFDNIDFSTVKGISFALDFRRTGGSQFKFNYTLAFAEGSGSNANSGANLASSGQPNLRILQPLDFDQRHSFNLNYDYRFGDKKEYKGPKFKTKKDKTVNLFEDVGFNLTFFLGSGTPYTRWSSAIPFNGGGRSSIVGQINGSSKPWNFRTNLRIDKNIDLKFKKKDEDENNPSRKTAILNIYLQVLNLFNTRNVMNVYQFTGAPDDDGYLTSTQGQAALSLNNSPAAFIDMYNIRMNAPGNYSLPRQTRIGLLFNFN